ncbi:uncharacterized protein LOC117344718 [Pecten maximus]|uniref:uncharacterized protein LOC117344718 n=1 Tax=Pecten maximus TaxID=6579 RepID=UPI001458AC1D|nr:uncharacterized protein LOC117344718 [Pecten maximus]
MHNRWGTVGAKQLILPVSSAHTQSAAASWSITAPNNTVSIPELAAQLFQYMQEAGFSINPPPAHVNATSRPDEDIAVATPEVQLPRTVTSTPVPAMVTASPRDINTNTLNFPYSSHIIPAAAAGSGSQVATQPIIQSVTEARLQPQQVPQTVTQLTNFPGPNGNSRTQPVSFSTVFQDVAGGLLSPTSPTYGGSSNTNTNPVHAHLTNTIHSLLMKATSVDFPYL